LPLWCTMKKCFYQQVYLWFWEFLHLPSSLTMFCSSIESLWLIWSIYMNFWFSDIEIFYTEEFFCEIWLSRCLQVSDKYLFFLWTHRPYSLRESSLCLLYICLLYLFCESCHIREDRDNNFWWYGK
jgi:hypothetical protein